MVKDDRKVEKDKTVVVIEWFFEPEQRLRVMLFEYEIKNDKKLVIISYFVGDTNK